MISDRMEGDEEEDVDRGRRAGFAGMPLALSDASSENTIGALHERHLVRYILEFCPDWFKDAERGMARVQPEIQIQTLMIMKESQEANFVTRNIIQRIMRSIAQSPVEMGGRSLM